MPQELIDKEDEVKEEDQKTVLNMTTKELQKTQSTVDEIKEENEDKEVEAKIDDKVSEEGDSDKETEKEEQIEISKAEYDKIQKRLKDKDDFIETLKKEKRQEVKRLEDKLKIKKEKLEEAWVEGGNEAAEAMKDVQKTESALEVAEYEEKIAGNKETILNQYEDFEDKVPEISRLLEKDGFSAKDIAEFKTDPYVNDPFILKNLFERAVISLSLQGKQTELEKLQSENASLKNKSKEFIDNIEKGSNRQTMNAGSGGTGHVAAGLIKKNAASMSREELREAQKGE